MFFSALLYYLVLIPISVLPFCVLHLKSRFLYVIIFYVVGYRKKVVLANIRNSFPEKSEKEQREIAKRFYKHLCDVLLESQTIFTISPKRLARHITCKNPELVNKYYEQGKNVILAIGHYNSWELLLTGLNSFLKHQAVVLYTPLSDSYLDKKMITARSRNGTIMLPTKGVKLFFETPSEKLHASLFAIDQSPADPTKCYWMKFLNQETAVLYGTEYFAKKYNQPVLFTRLNKIKRGHYELEFVEVTDKPLETAYGEITEKVTRILEKDIIAKPEFWLWSHKRWKHKKSGK
jgi:KDO2-lipid IV(A) lauroyltransferase